MVIFTEGTRKFYRKHGIELPKKMTHSEFKFLLECSKRAFK